jgi:hypothetical protein
VSALIRIDYWPKPGPLRDFDFCATRDGWEPGEPYGYGATEEAARAALLEMEEERQ